MTIYVMHVHRRHCDSCGRDEISSMLYSAEDAQRGARLIPCHSIGPTDPIRKLEIAPVHLPVCAECIDDTRATVGQEVHARWQETLKRKAVEYGPAPRPVHAKRAEPTLDDLA
jgi:hypothetical protein